MSAITTNNPPDDHKIVKKAVKIKTVAAMLDCSEKSVRRLIDRRQLRAVRTLRHLLVPTSEIDRFLSE
jgi:excisionase family DNA binding protein